MLFPIKNNLSDNSYNISTNNMQKTTFQNSTDPDQGNMEIKVCFFLGKV